MFANPIAGFSSLGTESADNLFAHEYPQKHTIKKTLISGQNLARGSLVGIITTGGKATLSLSAAADGSQTPYGILAQACDASGGDKECLIFTTGSFSAHGITYGTGHTAASVYEGLRGKGIMLELNPVIAP